VRVDTNATQECNEAQRKALRDATRTIVRTMKFRD
jgi:hypothetical protein